MEDQAATFQKELHYSILGLQDNEAEARIDAMSSSELMLGSGVLILSLELSIGLGCRLIIKQHSVACHNSQSEYTCCRAWA